MRRDGVARWHGPGDVYDLLRDEEIENTSRTLTEKMQRAEELLCEDPDNRGVRSTLREAESERMELGRKLRREQKMMRSVTEMRKHKVSACAVCKVQCRRPGGLPECMPARKGLIPGMQTEMPTPFA